MRARKNFPGVTCEACRSIEESEGDAPRCKTEAGCLVPPLDLDGERLLRTWSLCNGLRGLRAPHDLLRGLQEWELEMIAAIEREVIQQ